MRRNMLAKFTVKVAEFLKLPRPETYTDHAIRRSSASIMAASGATTSQLKTHFNWKSEATSLKYIETSDSAKKDISDMLSNHPSTSSNPPEEEKKNDQTVI